MEQIAHDFFAGLQMYMNLIVMGATAYLLFTFIDKTGGKKNWRKQ
jgi:hypothetical protein